MKRILQFRKSEKGYAIFKDETNLFEICRETLQFDVKNFYQAFYSDDNDFDDIEIENCIQDDKVAFHVYGCITNLMQQIKDKMKELDEVPKKNRINVKKEAADESYRNDNRRNVYNY